MGKFKQTFAAGSKDINKTMRKTTGSKKKGGKK